MTGSTDKSTDSRIRILEIAKPLFVERGYRGLSMRELGEAVGISKAAIYYHFRDKEALFSALLEESLLQLENLVEQAQANEDDARVQVTNIVGAILALPLEERAMIRVAMQEIGHMSEGARSAFLHQYDGRFLGRLRTIFASGIDAGHFRQIAPEAATWTLLGMMVPFFDAAGKVGVRAAGEVSIEEMLTIFFDGLCS